MLQVWGEGRLARHFDHPPGVSWPRTRTTHPCADKCARRTQSDSFPAVHSVIFAGIDEQIKQAGMLMLSVSPVVFTKPRTSFRNLELHGVKDDGLIALAHDQRHHAPGIAQFRHRSASHLRNKGIAHAPARASAFRGDSSEERKAKCFGSIFSNSSARASVASLICCSLCRAVIKKRKRAWCSSTAG